MTPLVPFALLIPFYAGHGTWTPLLMGPLVAFLLGWSGHNAVSYESDALWLHIVSGTSGRDDRRGWRILHDHAEADPVARAQARGHLAGIDSELG